MFQFLQPGFNFFTSRFTKHSKSLKYWWDRSRDVSSMNMNKFEAKHYRALGWDPWEISAEDLRWFAHAHCFLLNI